MTETCEKCRFWMKTLELNGSESLGHCRVSRPIIVESMLDHEVDEDESGAVEVWAGSVWPITVNTSWCGEFSRSEDVEIPSFDAFFSFLHGASPGYATTIKHRVLNDMRRKLALGLGYEERWNQIVRRRFGDVHGVGSARQAIAMAALNSMLSKDGGGQP